MRQKANPRPSVRARESCVPSSCARASHSASPAFSAPSPAAGPTPASLERHPGRQRLGNGPPVPTQLCAAGETPSAGDAWRTEAITPSPTATARHIVSIAPLVPACSLPPILTHSPTSRARCTSSLAAPCSAYLAHSVRRVAHADSRALCKHHTLLHTCQRGAGSHVTLDLEAVGRLEAEVVGGTKIGEAADVVSEVRGNVSQTPATVLANGGGRACRGAGSHASCGRWCCVRRSQRGTGGAAREIERSRERLKWRYRVATA